MLPGETASQPTETVVTVFHTAVIIMPAAPTAGDRLRFANDNKNDMHAQPTPLSFRPSSRHGLTQQGDF